MKPVSHGCIQKSRDTHDEGEPFALVATVEVGGSVLIPVEVINTGVLEVIVNVEPPDVSVNVSELYEVIVVVKGTRRSELEAELTAARWIPEVMPAIFVAVGRAPVDVKLAPSLSEMVIVSADEDTRALLPLDPELSKADDCPPPDPFELPAIEPTE